MATYQDGNVRKATKNTVTAMRRSAANRQCPECGRKSALVRVGDLVCCRWNDQGKCSYVKLPTRRYADWFNALGNEIPDGNRAAARAWLESENVDSDSIGPLVFVVADAIERDRPEAAQSAAKGALGETAGIMFIAYLCCPPL